MTKEQIELLKGFNEAVKHYGRYNFCTPDSSLQKQACNELIDLLQQLAAEKAAAVPKDEKFANVLLGCECLLKGIRAEIMMWLLLKEEQADKAWDCLVDAQGFVADAVRADIGFSKLQPHIEHLAKVERTVFPPQTFFSAGMIVGREDRTICGGGL